MRERFGVDVEWVGYEMHPGGRDKPSQLAFAEEGLEYVRPAAGRVDGHGALEAVEYAKQFGQVDSFVERIYYAYWRAGKDISQTEVLMELARGVVEDLGGLESAINERRYSDQIIPFDQPAHQTGIWHLPTFWIGEQVFAEQPWLAIEKALREQQDPVDSVSVVYHALDFPIDRAPDERPYTFINMVTTIDGKIVTGERGEDVQDLGSKVDHATMRTIEHAADAVMIGAGSQRSSAKITYPPHLLRFVVTRSGKLLYESKFFNDDPSKAIVVCPVSAVVPEGVRTLRVGETDVDLKVAFEKIRAEFGVQRLLVEGGSDLNTQVLTLELIDELFLTIAPKIKLGKNTPTYADGEPLSRAEVQSYELLETHRIDHEVFLRYRRKQVDSP